jgi:hypothetical protein
VSTTATLAPRRTHQAWDALTNHLNRWFYRPDLDALSIVLATAATHYDLTSDPVWLFIIGPSSSGKGAICINSLNNLLNIWPMGTLTDRTLISFKGHHAGGLLKKIGSNAILTFKDFTTVLSMRDDARGEIISQFREVYDGSFTRASGAEDVSYTWRGKVTVIAACTPALERAWGVKRDLGERFISVRWSRIGSVAMAEAAARQRGHDVEIRRLTASLAREFFDCRSEELPSLSHEQNHSIACLAEIVARMRGHVTRAQNAIIDVPHIEEAGRLNKALCSITSAHAALWNREPNEADLKISKRVALDTIPQTRSMFLDCFRTGAALAAYEIRNHSKLAPSSISYIGEELEALDIVTITKDSTNMVEYALTKDFSELLVLAGLL